MDSALTECEKELNYIHHQIQTIELETELLKTPFDLYGDKLSPLQKLLVRLKIVEPEREKCRYAKNSIYQLQQHLKKNIVVKKQFDYRSLIVSIYGVLEQYLDSLIVEYVENVNQLAVSTNEIPDEILKHHLNLSFELIEKVRHSSYRGRDTVESIVEGLHSCNLNNQSFRLNSSAYANRKANYRPDIITQMFSRIGISDILHSVIKLPEFQEDVDAIFPDLNVSTQDTKTVFRLLDDLAERRNDVAHGNSSDVLSIELIKETLQLIEASIRAIHKVTNRALLPIYQKKAVFTSPPIAVYDHSIVCIEIFGCVVESGDMLVAFTADQNLRSYRSCIIDELQVNGKSIARVDAISSTAKVGIKVQFHAKDNYEYSIVPKSHIL